jgi:hypothetical protein
MAVMSRAAHLEGGACQNLPPAVIDKYFQADGVRQRFEHATAKAMCGQCAVRAACLDDAIVDPPGHGIRGGESSNVLWQLHARWMDEHVEADALAAHAIAHQRRLGGVPASRNFARGDFKGVALACPKLGGA